mgnify:CR=1 FL=1
METPYNASVYIEDINKGMKSASNWQSTNWNFNHKNFVLEVNKTMNLSINRNYHGSSYQHGSPNDWLVNFIKLINNGRDKKLVSNYRKIMVISVMAKLYNTITENNIRLWFEHHHESTH